MSSYTITDFESCVQNALMGYGTEAFSPKASFASIFSGVSNLLNAYLTGANKPMAVVDISRVKKLLSSHNYTDLMGMEIYQPNRLNMKYDEWVIVLGKLIDYAVKIVHERDAVVVVKWLSGIAGDRASIAYRPVMNTKLFKENSDMLSRALSGKDVQVAVFSERFNNMTSLSNCCTDFNTASRHLTKGNAADLRKLVETISATGDDIMARIEEGTLTLDKTATRVIADVFLELARSVDLYAVISSLVITTGECLNASVDKLLKK